MKSTQRKWLLGLVLGVLAPGCVRGPQLQTLPSLGLRRVVVYRNGVAYFERAGRVDTESVEFRVRQSEVGDFLATLAVMERGGSSVRSAAFPLPREARPGQPAPSPNDRRTVRMTLDGRGHDLVVGYMAETPIWRPSYRLVMGSTDVQLQAYGIVQNISGEDWSNVSLSLVTGAPVSFRSELAEPMVTERPLVTDRGEVIDAVPQGDTQLAQDGSQPSPPRAPPVVTQETVVDETAEAEPAAPMAGGRARPSPARRSRAAGMGGAANGDYWDSPAAQRRAPQSITRVPVGTRANGVGPSQPRSLASLAAVAVQGGVTRYDLPTALTVPDHSATMVLLTARTVPGERLYLFAPDGGVADSVRHPFNVARFVNRTGAMLERGPVAIFEQGAFLGQGLLDPLPADATAVVPFALERGLAVDSNSAASIEGARLVSIHHSEVVLERFRTTRLTYHVRNGMDRDARVLVRVATPEGQSIFEPPAGTEQSTGTALVPIRVGVHGQAEQLVVLRSPFSMSSAWGDEQAQAAVRAFIALPGVAAPLRDALRAALELQEQSTHLTAERNDLQTRLQDLQVNLQETRDNLEAIRRNQTAADLRTRLTQRLSQLSGQLDALSRRVVELDTQLGERRVRMSEATRTLEVDANTVGTALGGAVAPPRPAPAGP